MLKTKTGDEDIDNMIESANAKFAKLEKPVFDRIEHLKEFKELVSKKILDLFSVLDTLKEMFRKFTAEE